MRERSSYTNLRDVTGSVVAVAEQGRQVRQRCAIQRVRQHLTSSPPHHVRTILECIHSQCDSIWTITRQWCQTTDQRRSSLPLPDLRVAPTGKGHAVHPSLLELFPRILDLSPRRAVELAEQLIHPRVVQLAASLRSVSMPTSVEVAMSGTMKSGWLYRRSLTWSGASCNARNQL
jgi:hypothetical protein